MHQLDDSFRKKRKQQEVERKRTLRRQIALAVSAGLVLAVSAGTYFLSGYWRPQAIETTETRPQAAAPEKPQRPVFVNAIVDLAGDPLIIRLGSAGGGASQKLHELPVPPDLNQPQIPETVQVLSDTMLSSSQRIMALPSSPEDFAFFQSQSGRNQPPTDLSALPDQTNTAPVEETTNDDAAATPDAAGGDEASDEVLVPVAGQDDLEEDGSIATDEEVPAEDMQATPSSEPGGMIGEDGADADAGWSETAGQPKEALPAIKPTAIEDTTTVGLVNREADRFRTTEDFTVSIKGERSLESIIAEYGFSADDAKKAAEAAKTIIGVDMLGDRYIVGLRGFRPDARQGRYGLAQLSVNAPEKYIGTIALGDDGQFVAGADPWIDEDLSSYSQTVTPEAQNLSYRLLDAVYSTATRNQVPSGVTGEAIMLMSRSFDLQAMTTKDDRLVIIFAKSGRDTGRNTGRVLYAAIRGPDRNLECFVYQPAPGADFSCMTEKDATHSVTTTNGMVNPVNGVLTSTFGPRRHPILGRVLLHKGVDWKAPIGTPVMAAFDGTIEYAGDGKGYGNVIRIAHGNGKTTAYAHLSRFENGVQPGLAVKAGDTIGFVGTTGLSTGPHLHFELYMNGVPINPLETAVAQATPSTDPDGAAVEILVNRIIHVESAGNARAKNSRSSATGLGQFINSTWIRMMRTYRPDLFQSMSSSALLALRFDPTISREMVEHLARENEARLRSHGHGITAGRLYLAHFLGPEGAHIVLAASGDASLAAILGSQVISANPFLTGKNAAYVVAWAEKKMTGRAVRATTDGPTVAQTVVRTSPEFVRYREAMQKVVETIETTL
ncbi:peptidoglycan DD-metalloendopeptidase family protein [Mesorhizobium sp. YR577]|uniref:peptidoglycan DD-metalloendopeptidase family protein n=1 Tax=Mesorhizobium sp. YR577 TaxID=1884373 RepID=UPI0008E7DDBA|nr:peptidoglycan DD-metalloendopeptidase family protein [Mesorhizobium sp. YR577]SFT72221.1 Peptidase family M23 [Mesorhizobium sp. YR577]